MHPRAASDQTPRPPHRLIALLLAATLALPVAAMLDETEVGGFRMFTRFFLYRVTVAAVAPSGEARQLGAAELRPHLGRDARRVVGLADRFVPGEAAAGLVEGGLGDLARLGCALAPGAAHAVALFERKGIDDATPSERRVQVSCAR